MVDSFGGGGLILREASRLQMLANVSRGLTAGHDRRALLLRQQHLHRVPDTLGVYIGGNVQHARSTQRRHGQEPYTRSVTRSQQLRKIPQRPGFWALAARAERAQMKS